MKAPCSIKDIWLRDKRYSVQTDSCLKTPDVRLVLLFMLRNNRVVFFQEYLQELTSTAYCASHETTCHDNQVSLPRQEVSINLQYIL